MIPRRVLYYGKDEPLPKQTTLHAGPLTAVFENGDLRWIRLGDAEVLRRVYAAVRDANWGTVAAVLSDLKIEQRGGGFNVSYVAEHRQREIHFRWAGRITGSLDGAILFEFDGQALSDFRRNRIGFCVLHPIRECAGKPCGVEKADGTVERGTFPLLVAPHQPFVDMRAISHEAAPGVTAEVRFEGDLFEMEDHRNWTDASYKTYCTPLRLPFPVEIKAGTRIRQTVRLSLKGRAPQVHAAASDAVEFRIGDRVSKLPAIGLCASSELSGRELRLLKALNLAHIRAAPAQVAHAKAVGLPLELELYDDAAAVDAPLARWLVFRRGEKSTSAQWIRHARERLKGAPVVAGTNAYFAELNRGRPDPALIDGACFSINPQVHAFDNDSLVENLAAQADVVASAKAFLAGKPVHVTPVTFRMRFNPDATGPSEPPPPDPRQRSLFGAGWTAVSLKYLAEAASITYYETAGPRGVMDADIVFPMYHVFADVGEFAGGEAVASESTRPLGLDGIVLRKGRRQRVILASFLPEVQSVRLNARGRVLIKHLDESNAERAIREPAKFRAEPGSPVEVSGHWLEFSLRPYAVVSVTSEL